MSQKKALDIAAKKKQILKSLEKIRGIGKDVWNEDAQEYINKLRDNDRF